MYWLYHFGGFQPNFGTHKGLVKTNVLPIFILLQLFMCILCDSDNNIEAKIIQESITIWYSMVENITNIIAQLLYIYIYTCIYTYIYIYIYIYIHIFALLTATIMIEAIIIMWYRSYKNIVATFLKLYHQYSRIVNLLWGRAQGW